MVIIIIATIVIATIRDKCDIKLTTPFKFKTGRTDCIPTDPERPYASSQVFTMIRAIMMMTMIIIMMMMMMMMMTMMMMMRRRRGRIDHPKIISKPENHPLLSGSAQETLDFLYRYWTVRQEFTIVSGQHSDKFEFVSKAHCHHLQ